MYSQRFQHSKPGFFPHSDMVKLAQILRCDTPQLFGKLLYRKTCRIGRANALPHKVQIERRIFSVGEKRIPNLITPGKVNICFRRISFQLRIRCIPPSQVKILGGKAVKRPFSRQHTQSARQLGQQICLSEDRLIIFWIADDIQPVMAGQIIRLIVNDLHVVSQRF